MKAASAQELFREKKSTPNRLKILAILFLPCFYIAMVQSLNNMRPLLEEETDLALLRRLEAQPQTTQRDLARELNISLGKLNYCLKALVEKGWVKAQRFYRQPNKKIYLYLLTPQGVKAKARLTAHFLQRKMAEHEALLQEIETLKREADAMEQKIGHRQRGKP